MLQAMVSSRRVILSAGLTLLTVTAEAEEDNASKDEILFWGFATVV